MDTSKEYIKMCDCPEIQKGHDFQHGDFAQAEKDCVLNLGPDHTFELIDDDSIWLPRQDQIQAMMPKYDSPSSMAVMFGLFCDNREIYEGIYAKKGHGFVRKFDTMEQLWLAFYMHEKHNKIWDGKEWIKK